MSPCGQVLIQPLLMDHDCRVGIVVFSSPSCQGMTLLLVMVKSEDKGLLCYRRGFEKNTDSEC